jgi:amino acid permease
LSLVFILTVAVGIQDRPSAAPKADPWNSDYKRFANPTFMEAAPSLTTFVFAYAGTPAFFGVVAEMRNPKEYTKALIVCQSIMTVIYLIISIVVYYYCGSFVASPALGSAGPMVKKVCYGISLPGLLITTTLCLHVRFFLKDTWADA